MKNINIILILLLITINQSFSQNKQQKIKTITANSFDTKGDTVQSNCIVKLYNKNGLETSEHDNRYYMMIDMVYDSLNRMIEKDALYGESFGNGTTFYSYTSNKTFEKEHAMGFYRELEREMNRSGQVTTEKELFLSGYYGQNSVSTTKYIYSSNLLKSKETITKSYEFDEEYINMNFNRPEELINKILKSKMVEEIKTTVNYEYNDSKQLITETEKNPTSIKIKTYTYNPETKLKIKETQKTDNFLSYELITNYNKAQKITKETKLFYYESSDEKGASTITKTDNTIEYQYDDLDNITKITEYSDNKKYSDQIYENGLLTKEISYDTQDEIYEILIYVYTYY